MDEQVVAGLLIAQAEALYMAVLSGPRTEENERIRHDITHPAPGDWVYMSYALGDEPDRIGRLIATKDEERRRYYYIETLTGSLARWENVEPRRLYASTHERVTGKSWPIGPRVSWLTDAHQRHGIPFSPGDEPLTTEP